MTKLDRERREKIALLWTAGHSFDAICDVVGMVAEDVAAIIYLRSLRDPAFIDRQGRTMADVMRDERLEKEQRRRAAKFHVSAERIAEMLPNVTTPRLRARLLESSPGAIRCQGNSGGAVQ